MMAIVNPLVHFKDLTQFVENKLSHDYVLPLAEVVSWRLGISKHRLAQGLTFVGFLCILTTFFSGFVSNTVGIIYPAYKSIQSLIGTNTNFQIGKPVHPLEDQQWLCYWVVFSLLMYVESVVGFLVSWIPFYHVVKVFFLMWLFLPRYRGANVLFVYFIVPQLQKYQPLIDIELKTILEPNGPSITPTTTTTTGKPPVADVPPPNEPSVAPLSGEKEGGLPIDKSIVANTSASQKLTSLISTISSVPSLTRQVIRSSSSQVSTTSGVSPATTTTTTTTT